MGEGRIKDSLKLSLKQEVHMWQNSVLFIVYVFKIEFWKNKSDPPGEIGGEILKVKI